MPGKFQAEVKKKKKTKPEKCIHMQNGELVPENILQQTTFVSAVLH